MDTFVVNKLMLNAGNSDQKHVVVSKGGIHVDAIVSIENPMPGADDVVTFRTNERTDTHVVHPTHNTALFKPATTVTAGTQVEANPLGGIIQAFD